MLSTHNIVYGIIILLATGICFFFFFATLMRKKRSEWSNWLPTIKNGVPGFIHSKFSEEMSDDMTLQNPRIHIKSEQFIPLTEFIGKGFKPITLKEWEKLYAKNKPYKWHLSEHQSQ